jgi:hypothetical protein
MGERRIRGFGGGPEGKTPFGRHRRRWEVDIKMGLQEGGCGGMDWFELAQNRNRWQALVTAVSYSRRTLLHGLST